MKGPRPTVTITSERWAVRSNLLMLLLPFSLEVFVPFVYVVVICEE